MLPSIRTPNVFDISKLLFVGAIWGASFIFIEIALTDFGPASIAAWRIFLGALVLLSIVFISAKKLPRGMKNWRYIFAVGALNSAIPFFLISWGQQFISSAESALLMATGTFSTLVLSHYTSVDERISRYKALGVLVGFIGVMVLMLWDIIESDFGGLQGQVAIILAGISYSISTVVARRLSHLPSIPVSAATTFSACLYLVPLAFLLENPLLVNVDMASSLSLGYLGIIATALAISIRFSIIRANGAVFTSQVGYLVPLFGVVFSGLYFADGIHFQTLFALALILLGIAISRKKSKSV